MNFVIDLVHRRVCGSVVEHWSAESEGLRFDSSWGLRIFSLSHAHDKTKFSSNFSNPRLWIHTDFYIIVQPVFAYTFPLPPSPTTVLRNVAAQLSISTLYQRSSSISQANPSSVRNFLAATFDNVVTIKYKQFSIRTMKIRQLTLSKAYKRLCNEFLDKLKLFRHYPTDLFALACIVIYK